MQSSNSEPKTTLPPSSANYAVNFLALLLFFGGIFLLRAVFPQAPAAVLLGVPLLFMLVPLFFYDFAVLKVHLRPSTGLMRPGAFDRQRLVIKLIGLFSTFLVILILYFIIPFYRSPFYAPFFDLLGYTAPVIIVLSVIYFAAIDRRQIDPYDGYWHAGCLFTGRFKEVNLIILREHALAWFIKAFFTPIMTGILAANINELFSLSWRNPAAAFLSLYNLLLILWYSMDVIYGVLGYVFTFRLLDTHIRSVEPTVIGWISCLLCYYPFSLLMVFDGPQYEDHLFWMHWFALNPVILYFWGTVIILLSLVYGLATVAFGYRMSNLTYRGIITGGPYRYTKHPAYLSKTISWWMITLPFYCVGDPLIAAKNTLALAMISLLYYIRAVTEENHLSNYKEYVEYAEWIKKHGVFSRIARRFPQWQYSLEKAKRWKSVVWFKRLK